MFLTHNNRCLEFLNNMFYSNGLRQIQKRSLNCFPHLKRRTRAEEHSGYILEPVRVQPVLFIFI